MPITLGCPSCGKRFRARDESAGKRVKCPYCAAPVSVPTGEEGAPLSDTPGRPAGPTSTPATPRQSGPPASAAPVASPDDWGAADAPKPYLPPPVPPPPPAPSPFGTSPSPFEEPPRPAPIPAGRHSKPPATRPAPAPRGSDSAKSPDQLAAPGWKKTKAGLGWVLFGLFLLALPGFAGFAKAMAARSGVELPRGPGDDWVSISGYLNTNDPNSIRMSKEELLDAGAYGIPVALGLLFVSFGRLTCGAAPRSSGAKGVFAFSGLFSFLALAGLITAAACDVLLFREEYWYASRGFLITALAAEFWFLTGLAASGSALKRPSAPRAVGMLGFVVALLVAVSTIGWKIYTEKFRPFPVTEDTRMYEQAALMIAWLLVVGCYWRAVRAVRGGIREFLDTVPA